MIKLGIFNPIDSDENEIMLARHMPVGKAWESVFDSTTNMGKLIKGLSGEYERLSILTEEISKEIDIEQTVQLLRDWEISVAIPDLCMDIDGTDSERQAQIKGKFSNYEGVQTNADFVRVAAIFGFLVVVTPGVNWFTSATVSSLTRVGSTATAVTSTDHKLIDGRDVVIAGANESDYNGTFTASVVNDTTFTYTVGGTPTTPATGTITSIYSTALVRQNTLIVAVTGGSYVDGQFPVEFPIPFVSGGSNIIQCVFNQLVPATVEVILVDGN